jgi:hypothetical protein
MKKYSFVFRAVPIFLATGLLMASDTSPVNLVTNGSFETGLYSWTFTLGSGVQGTQYQDGDTHSNGNWSEAVQAWSPASSVPWGAVLSQNQIALSAGQVVTVSFDGMASTTNPLTVGIQQTSSPWFWYGLKTFSLTPSWNTYTFTFTMPANDSDAALNFEMGNMAGTVWIDNAAVTVAGPPPGAAPSIALGDIPSYAYGNPLYDPNLTALKQDENEINRKFSFMVGFIDWANNGSPLLFTDMQPTLDALKNAGYGVVVTWCAQDEQGPYLDPRYDYASILTGQYDAYILQWAQSAAAWGKVFYLRLFHEMNGYWYPWGLNVNGNTPALAIQAWQHVHNIFQSAGATNVKFLWEPTYHTYDWLLDPLASFYPGDAYVDWLGVDGYNWGQYGLQTFWVPFMSPTELLQYTYNEMISTVSSVKPVMIVETASAEGAVSTDKAAWITQLQNDATLFPNLKAVGYYDGYSEDGTLDGGGLPLSFWRFDGDSYSLAAFQALSADIRWQSALP